MKTARIILFSIIFLAMLETIMTPKINLLGLTLDVKESGLEKGGQR